MNKYFYSMIFVFISANSYSSDVEIQINGKILGQSCNVSSADLIKNINFPDIDPSSFSQIGSYTPSQKFTINLKNCTGSVSNLYYQFTGEADENNNKLFKITGGNNSNTGSLSSGLAIEVLDDTQNVIPVNSKVKFNTTITSANYSLNFNVRYKSTTLDVIPGDASSILYLDMYYD
jgi:type 1 fimbria pilin